MTLEKCPSCGRWVGDGVHLGPGGYAKEYDDCPQSKSQMEILKQLHDMFDSTSAKFE